MQLDTGEMDYERFAIAPRGAWVSIGVTGDTKRNKAQIPSVVNKEAQGTTAMTLETDTLWNSTSYWSEPAEQAFAIARRKARRQTIVDRLRGRRPNLVSFHDVARRTGLLQESRERSQSVLLDQIVGSFGKEHLFTRSFYPMRDSLLPRWKRAFAVAHGSRGYEPIELYEAEGYFYVVDGHFRVSVARALGYETIQARVHRWI